MWTPRGLSAAVTALSARLDQMEETLVQLQEDLELHVEYHLKHADPAWAPRYVYLNQLPLDF